MKVMDLIEALHAANHLYKDTCGAPLEIFDLKFHDEDYDGKLTIEASRKVTYVNDEYSQGRSARRPVRKISVGFEVEDGEIVDRCVQFEEEVDDG